MEEYIATVLKAENILNNALSARIAIPLFCGLGHQNYIRHLEHWN